MTDDEPRPNSTRLRRSFTAVQAVARAAWLPLLSAKRWRAQMAALGIPPGVALCDLDYRFPTHRQLAWQWVAWWGTALTLTAAGFMISAGVILAGHVGETRWGFLEFGVIPLVLSAALAIGSSVPASNTLILGWGAATFVQCVSPWAWAYSFFAVRGVLICAIAPALVVGLRYARTASLVRRGIGVVLSPVGATLFTIGGLWFVNVVTAAAVVLPYSIAALSWHEGLGVFSYVTGPGLGFVVYWASEEVLHGARLSVYVTLFLLVSRLLPDQLAGRGRQ